MVLAVALGSGDARALPIPIAEGFESYDVESGGFLLAPSDSLSFINNAGVVGPKPILEMSEAEWDHQLGVNAKGPFLCAQAAVRQMQAEGKSGNVINIGSIAGDNAFPNRVGYCASKAALHHMTRVMAVEWASLGVRSGPFPALGLLLSSMACTPRNARRSTGPAGVPTLGLSDAPIGS